MVASNGDELDLSIGLWMWEAKGGELDNFNQLTSKWTTSDEWAAAQLVRASLILTVLIAATVFALVGTQTKVLVSIARGVGSSVRVVRILREYRVDEFALALVVLACAVLCIEAPAQWRSAFRNDHEDSPRTTYQGWNELSSGAMIPTEFQDRTFCGLPCRMCTATGLVATVLAFMLGVSGAYGACQYYMAGKDNGMRSAPTAVARPSESDEQLATVLTRAPSSMAGASPEEAAPVARAVHFNIGMNIARAIPLVTVFTRALSRAWTAVNSRDADGHDDVDADIEMALQEADRETAADRASAEGAQGEEETKIESAKGVRE